MNRITSAFLLFSCLVAAQDKVVTKKVYFDPIIRTSLFFPVAFGDNMLAKAHKPQFGGAMNASLFSLLGVRAGIGGSIAHYKVDDRTLAGDFRRSSYMALYPFLAYPIAVSDKITLSPEVGGGFAFIHQSKSPDRESDQEGFELRAGVYASYRLSQHTSVYGGISYQHAQLEGQAPPALKDYYSKMEQLQIGIGLQVNILTKYNP